MSNNFHDEFLVTERSLITVGYPWQGKPYPLAQKEKQPCKMGLRRLICFILEECSDY